MAAQVVDLVQVPSEQRDVEWLKTSLQVAVELEFATIPVYLSGMWSIKPPASPPPSVAHTLILSVVLEEMLHMGLACNMLSAIGGTPAITAPTYPGGLPGGVRPELEVYLAGLSPTTVAMYMDIETPEGPGPSPPDTYPTIGAFYDAIAEAFKTAELPSPLLTANQVALDVGVPDPDHPEKPTFLDEPFGVLKTLDDVALAIATIKDQGEGSTQSPDTGPEFGRPGELAHFYRFGEILNGKRLVIAPDGTWGYTGEDVPFPDCYPVARVPEGGYPGGPGMEAFDAQFAMLIQQLEKAWSGGGTTALNGAVGTMEGLGGLAGKIVTQQIDGTAENYGPDFIPASS